MKNHIACKLYYNNGDEGVFVGFKGRCSEDNILYNIKKGGRWCSQPDNDCKKYYEGGFQNIKNDFPCNESILFDKWQWSAGEVFKNKKPFPISKIEIGNIAVLTTVFASDKEVNRKIIGFFKIKSIKENKNIIYADEYYKLRLPLDMAKQLNFWEYYKNDENNKPEWKQKLFRYFKYDEQVPCVLHDLLTLVQNEDDQLMIKKLLIEDFSEYAEKRPDFKGAIESNSVEKTLKERKYGKGGESENHKKLKEYIAKNPNIIGLNSNEVFPIQEHPFISGDLVDILFKPIKGDKNTVVEIELDNVVPGIHQAIKYRALRCSQIGLPLDSEKVRAVIVAWAINKNEKELCKKYQIEYYEKKLLQIDF
jgi:hypothetical protein